MESDRGGGCREKSAKNVVTTNSTLSSFFSSLSTEHLNWNTLEARQETLLHNSDFFLQRA